MLDAAASCWLTTLDPDASHSRQHPESLRVPKERGGWRAPQAPHSKSGLDQAHRRGGCRKGVSLPSPSRSTSLLGSRGPGAQGLVISHRNAPGPRGLACRE